MNKKLIFDDVKIIELIEHMTQGDFLKKLIIKNYYQNLIYQTILYKIISLFHLRKIL